MSQKPLSLHTTPELVHHFTSTNNNQDLIDMLQKHNITGYDLFFLTEEEYIKYLQYKGSHALRTVKKIICESLLNELKLRWIINNNEEISISLDNNHRVKLSDWLPYISGIAQIEANDILFKDGFNNIISPTVEIVPLMWISPERFKTLKIGNSKNYLRSEYKRDKNFKEFDEKEMKEREKDRGLNITTGVKDDKQKAVINSTTWYSNNIVDKPRGDGKSTTKYAGDSLNLNNQVLNTVDLYTTIEKDKENMKNNIKEEEKTKLPVNHTPIRNSTNTYSNHKLNKEGVAGYDKYDYNTNTPISNSNNNKYTNTNNNSSSINPKSNQYGYNMDKCRQYSYNTKKENHSNSTNIPISTSSKNYTTNPNTGNTTSSHQTSQNYQHQSRPAKYYEQINNHDDDSMIVNNSNNNNNKGNRNQFIPGENKQISVKTDQIVNSNNSNNGNKYSSIYKSNNQLQKPLHNDDLMFSTALPQNVEVRYKSEKRIYRQRPGNSKTGASWNNMNSNYMVSNGTNEWLENSNNPNWMSSGDDAIKFKPSYQWNIRSDNNYGMLSSMENSNMISNWDDIRGKYDVENEDMNIPKQSGYNAFNSKSMRQIPKANRVFNEDFNDDYD